MYLNVLLYYKPTPGKGEKIKPRRRVSVRMKLHILYEGAAGALHLAIGLWMVRGGRIMASFKRAMNARQRGSRIWIAIRNNASCESVELADMT